ncbi:DUF4917 family protein [Aeromonas hydrophila]|uniref:DUF4917 family protein n=1 Tax=Aeromonas hydrophila TaxID=644 RepID=UPI0023B06DE2|nr:DUF4917 family protein [Aeromonas hydrophila]MDE8809498.1 DUF4917 family protein [Aeromonas hydrophila]
MHVIEQWLDIADDFSEALLLGNGASRAVDNCFSYDSLKLRAEDLGLLNENVTKLFEFFNTSDFELVLRLIWQASNVNKALNIADGNTYEAYIHVRECLINAVQDIHPQHADILEHLPHTYHFTKRFNTILSLNYDIFLYWTMMYGNDRQDLHKFKDCWIRAEFDENWEDYRQSFNDYDRDVSLVFYPHGNLVLARNNIECESKLAGRSSNLLDSILTSWRSESYIPLFVSEGTSPQKISSINNSHYLSTVYREVIPSITDNLVIYGWDFGQHDIHILNRLKKTTIRTIAVSVFQRNQAFCNRVEQMIHDYIRNDIEVVFFDSASPGCWKNPVNAD